MYSLFYLIEINNDETLFSYPLKLKEIQMEKHLLYNYFFLFIKNIHSFLQTTKYYFIALNLVILILFKVKNFLI